MPIRKIDVISYHELETSYLSAIAESQLVAMQVITKKRSPQWGIEEMEKIRANTPKPNSN